MEETANPPRMLTPEELRAFIKVAREVRKWSQEQLAEIAGLSTRTVQRVETGEPSGTDTRRALARAFDFDDIDVLNKPFKIPTAEEMAEQEAAFEKDHTRLARRQVRAETTALKKAASTYRTEIVALKRRADSLEAQLRRITKGQSKAKAAEPVEESGQKLRFTAKGFASQRRRLGLSAAECGLLLGTSGQSVYNWEDGKAKPRARHLAAIASLRTMGKKEAAAKLAELRQ
jgi:transcriptional regulator with XRE-family HTH domain